MRYTLTITGTTASPGFIQKATDVLVAAFDGTPDVSLEFEDPAPRSTGPVDFTTEPVSVVINLTDAGTAISVSARDGDVIAQGATVDAAMASIGTLSVAVPVPPPIADVPVVAQSVAQEAL